MGIRGTNAETDFNTSTTITLPAGSVLGDFVVLFSLNTGNDQAGPTSSTGWAQPFSTGAGTWVGGIYSKLLDSTDISNGSITIKTTGPFFSPQSNSITELVAFVGASGGIREVDNNGYGGVPGSLTVSTSSAVTNTDLGLFFSGFSVPSSSPSASVNLGTVLQSVNDANATGLLASFPMPGGITSVIFTTTGAGTNENLGLVVIVEGEGGSGGGMLLVNPGMDGNMRPQMNGGMNG
jgi:hypothetical protein